MEGRTLVEIFSADVEVQIKITPVVAVVILGIEPPLIIYFQIVVSPILLLLLLLA